MSFPRREGEGELNSSLKGKGLPGLGGGGGGEKGTHLYTAEGKGDFSFRIEREKRKGDHPTFFRGEITARWAERKKGGGGSLLDAFETRKKESSMSTEQQDRGGRKGNPVILIRRGT